MISGEQFQLLTEISLCSKMDCFKRDQLKNIDQNIKLMQEVDQDQIHKYKKIFIYSDFIKDFFNKFQHSLAKDTILISHNSDHGVTKEHLDFINNPNIKKWFCQNRFIQHDKLFSLPIGIANSQWPHGDQTLIKKVKDKNNVKANLVFKNFDIDTQSYIRTACNNITNNNNILMSRSASQEKYWNNISESMFVISPPGNGVDCHRIWECLYLRAVPIVKYHEAFSQFTHLPILFIDDWRQVTVEFLRSKIPEYATVDFDSVPELTLTFWENKINK